MATDDFVRWEDLDLDHFLDDYTDDEVTGECKPADEGSDSDAENVPPPKRARSDKTTRSRSTKDVTSAYICPVCAKELRSISGFRGHVYKQHNNPHLKACDHKKNMTQVKGTSQMSADTMTSELLGVAKRLAINRIAEYPTFRSADSVSNIAKHLQIKGMPDSLDIDSRFLKLYLNDIINQSEREYLFSRFHELRLDINLRSQVLGSLQLHNSEQTQIHFYQCFLDELLEATLRLYTSHVKSAAAANTTASKHKLKDTENEVLYYVSGYIIRKVSSHGDINMDLLRILHKPTPETEHATWTTKLDRGGLKYPTKVFFQLMVEMDQIISSDTRVSAQSLAKDTTMERIMDAVAVKLCWDDICTLASVETANSLPTLEAIVRTFFVVKGFSIAHRLRQQIAVSQRQKASLRHTLKQKST